MRTRGYAVFSPRSNDAIVRAASAFSTAKLLDEPLICLPRTNELVDRCPLPYTVLNTSQGFSQKMQGVRQGYVTYGSPS